MHRTAPLWGALAEVDRRAGSLALSLPLLSVFKAKGILRYEDLFPDRLVRAEDLSNYKLVEPGEIVLNKMSAATGAVGRASERGLVSPDYAVLRVTSSADSSYLSYLLSSDGFCKNEVEPRLQGIGVGDVSNARTPRVTMTSYLNPVVFLPDVPTQQRIAGYLDRETGEIDAMIAKMNELAGQLEARRTIAIQAAAIGRFSPISGDVSGVPIGAVGTVVLGKMLDAKKIRHADATDLPYIRAANIQSNGLRLDDVKTMPYTPREAGNLNLRKDDILVVEGGAVGTAVLLTEDMDGWSFQKTVNRIRPGRDVSSRWLTYVLRSYRDEGVFDLVCSGTTIAHLTAEKLSALRVPLLDLDNQQRIADHLDEVTGRIDAMLAKVAELKSLLTERRAALITDVVTGRKEVA